MSSSDATSFNRDLALPALAILSGSVVAAAASFGTRLVMARSLSPAELGDVVMAIAVVSVIGGVAGLGLHLAATQRLASGIDRSPEQWATTARTAVAVGLLTGVLATIVCLLAAYPLAALWRQPGLVGPLMALSPVAGLLPVGLAVLGVARAHEDLFGRAVLRDGSGGVARLVLVALTALAGGGATAQAAAFSAGVGVAELGFFAHGVRRGWYRGARGSWDGELIRGLRPFALLALVSQLAQWFDLLLLGAMASATQVGLYGVARSLLRVVALVAEAAGHRFLPRAAQAVAAGSGQTVDRLYGGARAIVLIPVGPLAAVALAAPRELLVLLFGADYAPGAPALRLLALIVILVVAVGVPDRLLIAAGSPGTVSRIRAVAIVIGTAVGLWAIPRWQALGAALAWGVMAVVEAGLFTLSLRGRHPVRIVTRGLWAVLAVTVVLPVAVGWLAHARQLEPRLVLALVVSAAGLGALAALVGVARASGASSPASE